MMLAWMKGMSKELLEKIIDEPDSEITPIPKPVEPVVVQKAFATGEESRFKELLLKEAVKCKTYEDDSTRTIAIRPDDFPKLRKRLSDAGMIPNVFIDGQVNAVERAVKREEKDKVQLEE